MNSLRRDLIKTLYIFPYIGVLSLSDIFFPEPQTSFSAERLWSLFFGSMSKGNLHSVILSFDCLGSVFLFCLLFGDYISKEFGDAKPYIFTRIPCRWKRAVRRTLTLLALSSLWILWMLLAKTMIALRMTVRWSVDKEFVSELVLIGLLFAPTVLDICLVCNWIAVRYGETIGLLSSFALVLILECAAIMLFDLPANILLNPLCFNSCIMKMKPFVCLKIMTGFLYTAALTAGSAIYMSRIDLF